MTPSAAVVHNWGWANAVGVPFLPDAAVVSEVRLCFGTHVVVAAVGLRNAQSHAFLPVLNAAVGGAGAIRPSVPNKQDWSGVAPSSLPVATPGH